VSVLYTLTLRCNQKINEINYTTAKAQNLAYLSLPVNGFEKKWNTKPQTAVSFMEELFKRLLYFLSTMSGSLYDDVTPVPLYCVWRWSALGST